MNNNMNNYGNNFNNNLSHSMAIDPNNNGIIKSFGNMYGDINNNTTGQMNTCMNNNMNNQINNNYMNYQMKNNMNNQMNNIMNNKMNINNANSLLNNNYINTPMINNYMNNQMTDNINNQINNKNMTAQDNYYNFLCNTWNNLQFYKNMNNTNEQNSQYFPNKMKFVNNNLSKTQNLLRQNLTFDIDYSQNQRKINILFETSSGHKITVLCNPKVRIKDLLRKFVEKIGVSENVIDDSFYFLYNGCKIKKNENKTIEEMHMLNCSVIIVIDKSAVLGA
jgi:hypothetical protein